VRVHACQGVGDTNCIIAVHVPLSRNSHGVQIPVRVPVLVPGSGFRVRARSPGPHNPLHLQASRATSAAERASSLFPFENPTREPRILWIGEASRCCSPTILNAFGKRAYTREERLDAFQRLQVPPVATLSHATVIRLGQVVGATHVVIGSFRLTGGMISVRAQNIRLDTGRMEHEFVEAGPLEDLFAIFGRVSRRLAGQSASDALPQRPALPVFENYIKGLIATSTPAKIGHLEAAIKLDPGFDRARLALWNVHHEDANGQAALVAAAAVAETSPMYPRARFSVALSLIQLNRLDDAFATLRTLADRSPSATLMNNIGVIQLRRPVTPETGRATYYFNQALKLDEDDQDYYFNLGYAVLGREGCGLGDLLAARSRPSQPGGWRSACRTRSCATGNGCGRRGGARAGARNAVVLDVRRVGEEARHCRAKRSPAGSSGSSRRWRCRRFTESTT
jgi:hypothetical protein